MGKTALSPLTNATPLDTLARHRAQLQEIEDGLYALLDSPDLPTEVRLRTLGAVESVSQAQAALSPYQSLGAWVRHHRTERRIELGELARRAQMGEEAIREIERGGHATRNDAIALAMGLFVDGDMVAARKLAVQLVGQVG